MFEGWIQSIAAAPPEMIPVSVVLSGMGFFFGFRSLKRFRLIEDVPSAKVRSAPQGYVELQGVAVMMDGEPIVSPLSGMSCCWYHYRIEEGAGKKWTTVEHGTSDGLFVLRDSTGDCVIDPEGADVDSLHHNSWVEYNDGRGVPNANIDWSLMAASSGVQGRALSTLVNRRVLGAGSYRCTERIIAEGDDLYAIGWFHSQDDTDLAQIEHDLVGERLRQWKREPETMPARFDRNGDGKIDFSEWAEVREEAVRQIREELDQNARNTHLHTMSKPKGQVYMLSNRRAADLVRRYKWLSALGFVAFFAFGVIATVMLGARLV